MPYLPARFSSKETQSEISPACVSTFNANNQSGADCLAADVGATGSFGAHALPVMASAYARGATSIFGYLALIADAVREQARAAFADIEVHAIKLGFVGTLDNLGIVAEASTDYAKVPLISHMPTLSWWNKQHINAYHEAFTELILQQTALLIGSHSTLWRWLLPNWNAERPPSARDIALATGELGASFTLVTGIALPERNIENILVAPNTLSASAKFQRHEGSFAGTGDTLSATFTA